MRVYLAGPISKGDVVENIDNGIRWGVRLIKDGLTPYIPFVNGKLRQYDPFVDWHAGILAYEMQWLDMCEALFRLDGQSAGADEEVAYAEDMGIPVFYQEDYDNLIAYARTYDHA